MAIAAAAAPAPAHCVIHAWLHTATPLRITYRLHHGVVSHLAHEGLWPQSCSTTGTSTTSLRMQCSWVCMLRGALTISCNQQPPFTQTITCKPEEPTAQSLPVPVTVPGKPLTAAMPAAEAGAAPPAELGAEEPAPATLGLLRCRQLHEKSIWCSWSKHTFFDGMSAGNA